MFLKMTQADLEDAEGFVVFSLNGRIVREEGSAILREAIGSFVALPDRPRYFVLEMSDVSDVDDFGVGALVAGLTTLMSHDCRLLLCGLAKPVSDLLQVTKLWPLFEIYATLEAALESCVTQK